MKSFVCLVLVLLNKSYQCPTHHFFQRRDQHAEVRVETEEGADSVALGEHRSRTVDPQNTHLGTRNNASTDRISNAISVVLVSPLASPIILVAKNAMPMAIIPRSHDAQKSAA